MPLGIKVASTFFFVYAAVGLIWGLSYWYLIGQPHISWPLAGFYLVVALLFVWVGRNLQRGRTVLWIGRILGVLAILGGFNAIGRSSLVMNHPGIRVLLIAKLAIGVVITISLSLTGGRRQGPHPTLPRKRGREMRVADWWASARPPPYPPPQAGEGNESR